MNSKKIIFFLLIGMGLSLFSEEPTRELLSLQDCVNYALDKNPSLLKLKEELVKNKGLMVQARSGALPQVTAASTLETQDKGRFGTPFGPEQNQDDWGVSLRVTQVLYAGGKLSAAMDIAKLQEGSILQDVQNMIDEVILAVRKNYYQVIYQKDLIQVSEKSVGLLEEEVEQQRKKLSAGTATKFNVLRAEVELSNAKPTLIRARNNYRIALAELAKVMGYDLPSDLRKLPFEIDARFPDQKGEIDVDALIQKSLQNRPELKSLSFQIQAREKQLKIDRSGILPTFSAFLGYDWLSDRYKTDLNQTNEGYIAGIQGEWKIFDGFESDAKMDQTKAQVRQLRHDMDDQKSTIELQVRRSYSGYLEAQELLGSQLKNVELAEESLRLARVRFDAGAGLQLDTLSSQVALTQARTNELQSRYDLALSIAELERSTGIPMVIVNTKDLPPPSKPDKVSDLVPRAVPQTSGPVQPPHAVSSETPTVTIVADKEPLPHGDPAFQIPDKLPQESDQALKLPPIVP
ncbi:MAG: TolC family protein [Verrucomicrobiota bacterium]